VKPRKCKSCRNPFTPTRPMQSVCSVSCALELVAKLKAKKAAQDAREQRRSRREALEKVKTRGEHLREAQAAVNAYVRARDANEPCISCDRPSSWGGQWHASHFRSVGSNPALRFNLLNIRKACSICNVWLSSNYAGYRPRLIEKIGLERVEWLEKEHGPRKYDIEYLKRLKRIFREKARRAKRLQDRRMRTEGEIPRAAGLPEALLPVHEDWEV